MEFRDFEGGRMISVLLFGLEWWMEIVFLCKKPFQGFSL